MTPNGMNFRFCFRLIGHCAGQTEAGLTQIADLEGELTQLQNLNAKLEEDLLAAERTGSRMSKPGNGHDPNDNLMASAQGKLQQPSQH